MIFTDKAHSFLPEIARDSHDSLVLNVISQEIFAGNLDNISRTKCYQKFFLLHPEISWSFLASMVSRNAGWNMCDLYGSAFSEFLEKPLRKRLILTYERANWLIFRDAYPQLLVYHYSTKVNRPLFHLLKNFFVSNFMVEEWVRYWDHPDQARLMYALIVNEQHVIQKPVIQHPTYKKRIFWSPLFIVQELFHFSCVIFPTLEGELYGLSVVQFRQVNKRIEMGKKLAAILFHTDLYPYFLHFARKTEHTGSRHDYEKYLDVHKQRDTPFLRTVIPVVEHHVRRNIDWSIVKRIKAEWLNDPADDFPVPMTDWFLNKQEQIQRLAYIKKGLSK